MNDQYVDRLIQSYLDNALTDQELEEFGALMTQSESARNRFWELAEIHGLAPQAAATLGLRLEQIDAEPPSPQGPADAGMWDRASSFTRRRQSSFALAAGVLLGVLISAFAWPARGMPQLPTLTHLLHEGFESGDAPAVNGFPLSPDSWSGDYTQIVTDQAEVVPAEGAKMLQILRADYDGKPEPEGSYCGDLYRLIDVRSLQERSPHTNPVMHASAAYNMATRPTGEELRYTIRLLALTSDTITASTRAEVQLLDDYALATARQNLQLDNDPTSWQTGQTELRLPPETDFVLLHVGITYGYLEGGVRRITFPGQFVDDIQISLSDAPH